MITEFAHRKGVEQMGIYLYGNRKWFFLTLISSILISIRGIFTAYIVGEFINIATHGNFNDLKQHIIISITGVISLYILNLFYIYAKNQLLLTANVTIKNVIFDQLLTQEKAQSTKDNISLMTNDLKQLETKGFINEIVILQNLFLFIAASSPLILSKLFSDKIKNTSKVWSQKNSDYLGKLTDYLSGIDTVINYNVQKIIKKDFDKTANDLE